MTYDLRNNTINVILWFQWFVLQLNGTPYVGDGTVVFGDEVHYGLSVVA